jgi:deoxyribose-phosphate aldolase
VELQEKGLERYLESTLLRADADKKDIKRLCEKALHYNFLGICINPYFVPYAVSLVGKQHKVITVAGFPLGCAPGIVKAFEAERAFENGADEVDMVINLAAVKDREKGTIIQEIKEVARTGPVVKVIIESGYLSIDEMIFACECATEGGATFIKTSTGFGPRGVLLEDIHLLRRILPPEVGIKAAGGIKTAGFAKELLSAGANRIGTSTAEQIISPQKLI